MSSPPAIEARGLGKCYRIGAERQHHNSLRDLLSERLTSLFQGMPRRAATETFWALRDATFDIQRGQSVGIVGLNGAGKSTLLKLLCRITEPSSGFARIRGRLGALLEVGTGFHFELTGRENVYLYGSILGMSKEEIRRKFDAIVEFSGIQQFIDTPVKRYSSGMYVRLAFAVAAHLEPEILLLDEVLAVGDLAFQRKCIDFAKSLQQQDATILFVSHNMFSIKTMCDRIIYLRKGIIEYDGAVDAGIELYERDCRLSALSFVPTRPDEWPILITGCDLLDESGHSKSVFDFGERLTIRIHYDARQRLRNPNFIVAFIRSDGVACCNYSSEADGASPAQLSGTGVIELQTPPLKLVSEMYSVSILVREAGYQQILCGQIGKSFHVKHDLYDMHFGVFHEGGRWSAAAPTVDGLEPASSISDMRLNAVR